MAPAAGAEGAGTYSAFPGDTVYGVAQRFGVPVRTLIETNGLKPPYRLVAGQRLQVPMRQEHVVQAGDTLLAISRIYGVDQSSLVSINGLRPPYALKPGQRLTLPGRIDANLAEIPPGQLDPSTAPTSANATTGGSMTVEQLSSPTAQRAPKQQPPAQSAAVTQKSESAEPSKPESSAPAEPQNTAPSTAESTSPATTAVNPASAPQKPTAGATAAAKQANTEMAALPPEPVPSPRGGERFLWPVQGKVISNFGPKKGGLNNDGINISAPEGATVIAADNGVVAYAGNELRGFGNLLLIRHADGWVTAYAHNEKLLVKRGEKVKRGQAIAQIGSTGNVSAPQLHFELRKGTDPVDPLKYLGS
ncbi:MAG TPA: peptidoglycan DD-metalloendopeptidase family protein [Candidatus Acidoferrum sp.]|nr:peptidoglycan DD-metalloendopeptidase family protein [Candidatus Acidoferrum sp.]